MDPSLSSLQSTEAESVQTIGFNNRHSAYRFGSEPGSLRLGNIREDQSVLSLKLPESLRASSAIHISETESTRVQIRLERHRVSRPTRQTSGRSWTESSAPRFGCTCRSQCTSQCNLARQPSNFGRSCRKPTKRRSPQLRYI